MSHSILSNGMRLFFFSFFQFILFWVTDGLTPLHAILSSTASFLCEKNRYRKRNAEVREKGKKVKSKRRRRKKKAQC